MKSFQDRIHEVTTKGWISCGVWCAIYIAFVVWVAWGDWASLGWLVLLPIIADMFTTKYIPLELVEEVQTPHQRGRGCGQEESACQ